MSRTYRLRKESRRLTQWYGSANASTVHFGEGTYRLHIVQVNNMFWGPIIHVMFDTPCIIKDRQIVEKTNYSWGGSNVIYNEHASCWLRRMSNNRYYAFHEYPISSRDLPPGPHYSIVPIHWSVAHKGRSLMEYGREAKAKSGEKRAAKMELRKLLIKGIYDVDTRII